MVEQWLAKVVEGMQGTMKASIKRAARNVNEMKLDEFLFSHPAQVALLGIQFQWTAETQVRDSLGHGLLCQRTAGTQVGASCMV